MDNNFKRLFLEGEYKDLAYLSDTNLLTEDGCSFDVHRFILAKESMYFRELFCNTENNKIIFHVYDITGKILDQFLYYIYTRNLPESTENDWELFIASDLFLLDSLKFRIKKNIMDSISLDNCFPMYLTSLKMNDAELLKFSYRYVQTHFQALMNNNLLNFGEISRECLKNFLNDNNLCITGEHTVWKCIEKWIKIDPLCRLSSVPDFLKCLKTADINDLLATEIIHSDIICENPLYKDLMGTEFMNQSFCSLVVLKNIIQNSAGDSDFSLDQLQSHRHPNCLHIISRFKKSNVILYSTYDENIDLWRKLGETGPQFMKVKCIIVVGLKVYMFDSLFIRDVVYDLRRKQCTEMLKPRFKRIHYYAVKLGNRIYKIGGKLYGTSEDLTNVQFYDTEQGMWFDAAPMMSPVPDFKAVAYQNKIFLVGIELNKQYKVAHVYDPDLNRWSSFTPPSIFTVPSFFLEYHGKLLIIGGFRGSERFRTKVEFYDIETNSWGLFPELPCGYHPYKARVFLDQLIVFDGHFGENETTLPPVMWNDEEGSWKPLDMSFMKYINCVSDSIDNNVEISALLKELRDPATSFERSLFN